jgi:hypothetical protein
MPSAFSTWTVLPHKPIEKLEDNLWRVEGTMPNGKVQRAMIVVRMNDGRLVIHNAIALEDAEMAELEAWGKPSILVVPNGFHRQDAKIWKDRYPDLKVVCPSGARKRVEQVVKVDGALEEERGDDSLTFASIEGSKNTEPVLTVRSGDKSSIVLCDLVMNIPKRSGLIGFFLAPTGRPGIPRVARWITMKDKTAAVSHLDRLASTPGLTRILVGHGQTISDAPAETLKSVLKEVSS